MFEVYFIDSLNNKRMLSDDLVSDREAHKIIHDFLKERNYKAPYFREWIEDGAIIVDVGSHSEFFHIIDKS